MKKQIFALVTAIAALTMFKTASTEAFDGFSPEGFYIGGFGGANWIDIERRSHHHDGAFERFGDANRFDVGYVAGGTIGYKFCYGIRGEFEVAYRDAQRRKRHFDDSSFSDITVIDPTLHHHRRGRLSTVSYLANFIYDINLAEWNLCYWDIVPFVGVGIGYAHQENRRHHVLPLADVSISDSSSSFDGRRHHRRENGGFAWQVLAGVSYEIMQSVDIAVEYRFFQGPVRREDIYSNTLSGAVRYHF